MSPTVDDAAWPAGGGAGGRHAPAWRGLRHWWPVLAVAIAVGLYGGLASLAWWIQGEAHEVAARSMREFPGDEVISLIALVESPEHGLAERNRAVWALGQLADPRAAPLLERLHTGEPCDHATRLCQYELEKAVARCRGGNQAPRWLPLFPRPRDTVRPH